MMSKSAGDLLAVANAYKHAQQATSDQTVGYDLALAVFRRRHPEMSADEANVRVDRLVSQAIEAYGLWRDREDPEGLNL